MRIRRLNPAVEGAYRSILTRTSMENVRKLGVERIIAYSLSNNFALSRLGRSIGLQVKQAKGGELSWALQPETASIEAA